MPRWDPLEAVLAWYRGVGCGKWPRVGIRLAASARWGRGRAMRSRGLERKKSVFKCLPGAFSWSLIGVQWVSGSEVGD